MVGHALVDYESAGAYIKWMNITRMLIYLLANNGPPGPSKANFSFTEEPISWSLEKLQAVER
jgi:hypothetical protein